MPVSIIRNVGTAKRNIDDYIPSLLKNVFPQLQQFGINMYNKPFMQDKVTVSYNGDTYDGYYWFQSIEVPDLGSKIIDEDITPDFIKNLIENEDIKVYYDDPSFLYWA